MENLERKKKRTASDLGERALLRSVIWPRIWSPTALHAGDDAAVIPLADGESLLFTTDAGPRTPFLRSLGMGTFEDLGHFYATMSLSDVAAMGGTPIGLVAAMLMPGEFESSAVAELVNGLAIACEEVNAEYVGGDTKEGNALRVITSVVGRVPSDEVLCRRGARPGQLLFTSGVAGRALSSYFAHRLKSAPPAGLLWRPRARVEFARELAKRRLASCCIDTSDGPFAAARDLAEFNNVGISLSCDGLGISETRPPRVDEKRWRSINLHVGGDFELMFAAEPFHRAAIEDLGGRVCGEIKESVAGGSVDVLGVLQDDIGKPWEHFVSTNRIYDELAEVFGS